MSFRAEGLVDCNDIDSFNSKLETLQRNWPENFADWLHSKKFRLSSLKETLEKCMIKCLRVKPGLGNPPNKWVNKLSESMNNIIKEAINYNAVIIVSFLEIINEKVFQQQKDELVRGIHDMGGYRLVPQLSKYSVDPLKWSSMIPDQRKFHAIKVLKMTNNDAVGIKNAAPSTCLSVPLEDCDIRNIPLPDGALKELWATSDFLSANDAISILIGGNYCMKGVDMAYTVTLTSCKNGTLLKCSCKTYALFDGICSHILAVVEKRGELNYVLDKYAATGGNPNKAISQAAQKRAGQKCLKKKQGKEKIM